MNPHSGKIVRLAVRLPASLKAELELRAAGGEGKTASDIVRQDLVDAPRLRERLRALAESDGTGQEMKNELAGIRDAVLAIQKQLAQLQAGAKSRRRSCAD